MDRQFAYCDHCNDYMEVEYVRGKWVCENCRFNLTSQVEHNLKKKHESKSKKSRRKSKTD